MAWILVFALGLAIAFVTAMLEGNGRDSVEDSPPTTVSSPDGVTAPVDLPLLMRKTEQHPDGTTTTIDFYSKDLASQGLGEDDPDEGIE